MHVYVPIFLIFFVLDKTLKFRVSQKSVTTNNISHLSVRAIVQDIEHNTEVVCQNGQTQYRIIIPVSYIPDVFQIEILL